MSNSVNDDPGFWRRLGRAFVNFFRFALIIALLVLVGAAVWFGVRELRRAFNQLATDTDVNERRIELLRSDVDNLMGDTSDEDAIAALGADLEELEGGVAALETSLTEELAQRDEQLATLEMQLADLMTETIAISQTVASLQDGLLALQDDANDNRSSIDALGGELDSVTLRLEELNEAFDQVRAEAGELADMRRALTLFRAWELLARARLYLAEGNAGLAADDVESALATINGLAAAAGDDDSLELQELQDRLVLVRDSLPDDPAAAQRDLATAWELLDAQILALAGGPPPLATPPATITATAPITATTPTSTPPAATPTATSSPVTATPAP